MIEVEGPLEEPPLGEGAALAHLRPRHRCAHDRRRLCFSLELRAGRIRRREQLTHLKRRVRGWGVSRLDRRPAALRFVPSPPSPFLWPLPAPFRPPCPLRWPLPPLPCLLLRSPSPQTPAARRFAPSARQSAADTCGITSVSSRAHDWWYASCETSSSPRAFCGT